MGRLQRLYTNTDLDTGRVIAECHGLVGCGMGIQNIQRHIGDAPNVSFYRKKDRGTYLYLIHCLQNVQGIGTAHLSQ